MTISVPLKKMNSKVTSSGNNIYYETIKQHAE